MPYISALVLLSIQAELTEGQGSDSIETLPSSGGAEVVNDSECAVLPSLKSCMLNVSPNLCPIHTQSS